MHTSATIHQRARPSVTTLGGRHAVAMVDRVMVVSLRAIAVSLWLGCAVAQVRVELTELDAALHEKCKSREQPADVEAVRRLLQDGANASTAGVWVQGK